MYINVAYVDDENPNLEDLTVPVRVNNCGYYRVHTGPVIETPHPEGRNDYQLLYIAAGKGYFYFKGSKEPTVVTKGNMVLFRPKEPQVYYYYAVDKTEVYWVHFTGWKVEEYLERYELPKEKMFSLPEFHQTILGYIIKLSESYSCSVRIMRI